MQTIVTSELVLEPLTAAHAEVMFGVLADPEIYRYLDHLPPPSPDYLHALYSKLERRKSPDDSQLWLNWVVRLPEQAPIGYVQATIASPSSAWIAFVLSSKHWGRGFGRQATLAMVEHLTSAFGVKQFMATVEADNKRSIRLLERLAFRSATAHDAAPHKLSPTERLFLR